MCNTDVNANVGESNVCGVDNLLNNEPTRINTLQSDL